EQEQGLGFDSFLIEIGEGYNLRAELKGYPIAGLDKEIKAVTYHNLRVVHTSGGLRVCIVFDV
ncbi:MAG: archease, partial [Acidobacteriaceae bacterium]